MLARTRLTFLALLCVSITQAVVIGKDLSRREAFDTYGPPRPAPQYGPPPLAQQHIPHREYGVPQQIPFREYGPPALKYGPPKLNFYGGDSSTSSSSGSFSGGLHEQIKSHFGVSKPFYGPPHILYKPAPQYGPPPQPLPKPIYGPPQKPVYGVPPQHRPAPSFGPPKQHYGPPPPLPPPQILPAPHPAPLFKPAPQPANSYGPPASGPLNLPTKTIYDAPPPNYGPPPLPISLPELQPANFNRVPETTVIVSGTHHHHQGGGGAIKQVQIQIDATGHTHSVSGSQAPFHTACDGWKPIPAPIGAYVEHNNIDTQSGYSQVTHDAGSTSFGTQYSGSTSQSSGSIIDDLTDEQLVAVALQGTFNSIGSSANGAHINSLDSDSQQIALGVIDDSYSKPPTDSYAPGSIHAQKFTGNYGLPPPPSQAIAAELVQEPINHHHQQSGFGLQIGNPLGNVHGFASHRGIRPSTPVIYRPPVPPGLLESIGATVQHLDQFGVKPQQQAATYIPPAANEIAQGAPELSSNTIYDASEQGLPPPPPPEVIIQQQLPLPPQQQHHFSMNNQYGPPPPQYTPSAHVRPIGPPLPPNEQYLAPQNRPSNNGFQQYNENVYSASNQHFVHTQVLPMQIIHQPRFKHLPLKQQVNVNDCGHGPSLVSDAATNDAYNVIAQSIPVAEQHTQFIANPTDSYSPSGSANELDHIGYASQKSSITALPDGTDPQNLPGLDGLNVISAQKSHIIQLNPDHGTQQNKQSFQIQFGGSSNNNKMGNIIETINTGEHTANHEEILSQGLLQSILTAIEQPQQQTNNDLIHNHNAQSRSDIEPNDDDTDSEAENNTETNAVAAANTQNEDEPKYNASQKIEVKVLPKHTKPQVNKTKEDVAIVKQIEPIIAEDVE